MKKVKAFLKFSPLVVIAGLLFYGHQEMVKAGTIKGVPDQQVVFVQTSTPSWAPIGSLWIAGTNNSVVKVQTNAYNSSGSIVYSNFSSVCLSNCAGTNAVLTNIFTGTFYTDTYPVATWVTIKP